ncbi:hypothetical protein GCM10010971_09070 [Silvimonas amylolytica]|uniref:Uncharacterized protein n=1 Tax=Silvimonas amylolytica TaxID=449663 RepID=A0ABQ2PIA3_9NEIS|nr:hypothetical protein GCM10010971_09070 [Silvimonas amylolytica]
MIKNCYQINPVFGRKEKIAEELLRSSQQAQKDGPIYANGMRNVPNPNPSAAICAVVQGGQWL